MSLAKEYINPTFAEDIDSAVEYAQRRFCHPSWNGNYVFLKDQKLSILSSNHICLADNRFPDLPATYLGTVGQRLRELASEGVNISELLYYAWYPNSETQKTVIRHKRPDSDSFSVKSATGYLVYSTEQGTPLWLRSYFHDSQYARDRIEMLEATPQEHYEKLIHDICKVTESGLHFDVGGLHDVLQNENGFHIRGIKYLTDGIGMADRRKQILLTDFALPCLKARKIPPSVRDDKDNGQAIIACNRNLYEKCKRAAHANGLEISEKHRYTLVGLEP